LCLLALTAIGGYCAHRLNDGHPLWVRLVVLLPCLTALAKLAAIAMGEYIAGGIDVAFAVSVLLIYALVASRFTSRPWLDIRTTKD
jgi:hypothetical protein